MIQKYISVIKLKKQTVTGAMDLLRITAIYLYVNTDAMVQSLKSLYTKRENRYKAYRIFLGPVILFSILLLSSSKNQAMWILREEILTLCLL